MNIPTIPARVEQSEVDRALSLAGPESDVYLHLKKRREAWLAHLEENRQQGEAIRVRREAAMATEVRERAAAHEAQRAADEARFVKRFVDDFSSRTPRHPWPILSAWLTACMTMSC